MSSSRKNRLKYITSLNSDDDFGGIPEVLYGSSSNRRKKKKKKQSRALKPLERAIYSMAKSYDKATKEYLDRHENSNKKKKNGWIRDFSKNYGKAMRKVGGGGIGLSGVPGLRLFD